MRYGFFDDKKREYVITRPDTPLPWADLTTTVRGAKAPSGAAIFIPRSHPDYPPQWLTRHYGVLCVGWPGVEPATFQPGERIHCRYRIWIHRGVPEQATVKRLYDSYASMQEIQWPQAPAAPATKLNNP